MSQEETMRAWLPSQVYRDESHAASVLGHLISQYELDASPRSGPLVFGVEHKATGRLVGHAGLSPVLDTVEVGFGIEVSEQRRGYGTEAVSALCTWGLKAFTLEEIIGLTAAKNVASQRVLLRSGFRAKERRLMRFQGVEQTVQIFEFNLDSTGAFAGHDSRPTRAPSGGE
jgi:RimJ/RimL family protein N-acetyltransferase